MRVIAGTLRRRTLEAPPGMATRPTSDRLRETLFNALAPRIEGARFLDLYAGSGAVGIEAASRGAERVVVVERAAGALKVLRANLEKLGLGGAVRVEAVSVVAFLKRVRPESAGFAFDIVFMDPPYDVADEYETALGLLGGEASRLLAQDALVIAEHRRKEKLEERYGGLERMRVLEQGDAALSFYKSAVRSQLSAGG
ncbi:MAG TPA: 16S rRNA (guanine(966)-N(2))-methyltransferase RsmD [Acidobacteriaceae bacterium]|jgi:16S rRNA (guanine(966)-N(2))-methyltransferase RsmD|nr:16S rRNA (guanine(966)-N(2))-methyltransferase RsmD [Acidobacteriaceae bacterium]